MTAVYLVLVFAVLQSFWWVIMKMLMQMKPVGGEYAVFPNHLVRMVSGFGSLLLIIWGLLRRGGFEFIASLPIEFWGWVAIQVPIEVAVAFCFVKAMQKSTASIAVHVTLFAPIVAIFVAYLLGIDRLPGTLSFVGIFLIVFGLYVLHFSPKRYGKNLIAPLIDIWQRRGEWLWYAIAVAVLGGFAAPITKRTIQLSDYAFAVGTLQFLGWGLVYLFLAVRSRDFRAAGKFPRIPTVLGLVTIGLLFGIANGFQAAAFNYHFAAAVSALKRLDAPFTVLWSFLPPLRAMEEEAGGKLRFRIVGSTIAFTGALLIGLGK